MSSGHRSLAFLPWYHISESKTIGRYTLHPYRQGSQESEPIQDPIAINNILTCYLERPFVRSDCESEESSVQNATIIRPDKLDFSLEDLEDLAPLQYVIALCAISNRDFRLDSPYLCSENLRIFVQNYPYPVPDSFSPVVSIPRKNGPGQHAFAEGKFREIKPSYVPKHDLNRNNPLNFDGTLAERLWSFYIGDKNMKTTWEKKLYPSLFSYYWANTDGLPKETELIYSHAAIERLLLGDRFGAKPLTKALENFLQQKSVAFDSINDSPRTWQSNNPKDSKSISGVWLNEITQVRNNFAHGKLSYPNNCTWTLDEHLLLSSFIYPLLLKLHISDSSSEAKFTIDCTDMRKIKRLEVILASNHYFKNTCPHTLNTTWTQLLTSADCSEDIQFSFLFS